ncbi:predicted protein [Naegleria gruberi]|uniref:Predicted protein n=1 Tax=Naegleria gruberi TaxID=5762 RepID=D2W2I2_NAEGR|nr:uncharacterized protein NAEGRDRAFT_75596 [Naegleria gruberi]EFC36751.1 predicted protein [Naegleria gruberi]|eukprot:XP_002669495.1 predicted protein [Naegleria gruberi strain NEG-M]
MLKKLRNGLKHSLHVKFEEKIDANKDKWSQVKVPGCFEIGVFNFYMDNYLYYDTEKKKFSVSNYEFKDKSMIKVITPVQAHPPIGECIISEGCSFRIIKDPIMLEKSKEEIRLRQDIINNYWNIYTATDIKDDYDVKPYFDMSNRIVLNYDNSISDLFPFMDLPDDADNKNFLYLDGNRTINGWEGTIYGYNKDCCMGVGKFILKKA